MMGAMSALEGLVIQRQTAAQQVADGLAARILAGAFGAGDRLRESAIASELGVARNTVREAVRILELSGLVRHEVNRGAVVISPTPDRVEALYAARERLETAAAARAARPEHLDGLKCAYQRLEQAALTHEAARIVDVDLQFHSAIVAMLDSTRLDAFYAELMVELRFYLMVLSVTDREYEQPEDLLVEHQEILTAIESGDRDAAVDLVRSHIDRNAARVVDIVTARSGQPAARRDAGN
jgi:DNA-binding GntR family transcriptional regulator